MTSFDALVIATGLIVSFLVGLAVVWAIEKIIGRDIS